MTDYTPVSTTTNHTEATMMQDPELTISIEEGLRKGNAQIIAAIDAEMRQNEDVMWSFGGENCITHRMHERQYNLAAARRSLLENDFVACSNLGLFNLTGEKNV